MRATVALALGGAAHEMRALQERARENAAEAGRRFRIDGERRNARGRRLAPLRRIVAEWQSEIGVDMERLECGHEQPRKKDIYGPTNAYSRRCRKCLPAKSQI